MRTGAVIAILAALGMSQLLVCGQQTATNSVGSATNTAALTEAQNVTLRDQANLILRVQEPGDTNMLEYTVSKTTKMRLTGPLVRPLKAKSGSDFGRRVLHLFSPFSDEQPNLPPGAEVSGPVNTRAWSTLVGWTPGRSAFPDDTWHDPPQLRLISVRVEKQPKQP
jgi:hypothetical protein